MCFVSLSIRPGWEKIWVGTNQNCWGASLTEDLEPQHQRRKRVGGEVGSGLILRERKGVLMLEPALMSGVMRVLVGAGVDDERRASCCGDGDGDGGGREQKEVQRHAMLGGCSW